MRLEGLQILVTLIAKAVEGVLADVLVVYVRAELTDASHGDELIVAEVDQRAAKFFAALDGCTGSFNKGSVDGLLAIGGGVSEVNMLGDGELRLRHVAEL